MTFAHLMLDLQRNRNHSIDLNRCLYILTDIKLQFRNVNKFRSYNVFSTMLITINNIHCCLLHLFTLDTMKKMLWIQPDFFFCFLSVPLIAHLRFQPRLISLEFILNCTNAAGRKCAVFAVQQSERTNISSTNLDNLQLIWKCWTIQYE